MLAHTGLQDVKILGGSINTDYHMSRGDPIWAGVMSIGSHVNEHTYPRVPSSGVSHCPEALQSLSVPEKKHQRFLAGVKAAKVKSGLVPGTGVEGEFCFQPQISLS